MVVRGRAMHAPTMSNCKIAYDVNKGLFYKILFTNLFPEKAEEINEIIRGIV